MLCVGVKRQGGKWRNPVHVGPSVLIHLRNTTTYKLQYLQFILNNGERWTVKKSKKVIHGRDRGIYRRVPTGPSSHFDRQCKSKECQCFCIRYNTNSLLLCEPNSDRTMPTTAVCSERELSYQENCLL